MCCERVVVVAFRRLQGLRLAVLSEARRVRLAAFLLQPYRLRTHSTREVPQDVQNVSRSAYTLHLHLQTENIDI